jgi:DNA modification methylase
VRDESLPINQVIVGDVLDVLLTLPDECVDCVVTSPPYWGLRDYGVEGQIGLEATPEEFVAKIQRICHAYVRTLPEILGQGREMGQMSP